MNNVWCDHDSHLQQLSRYSSTFNNVAIAYAFFFMFTIRSNHDHNNRLALQCGNSRSKMKCKKGFTRQSKQKKSTRDISRTFYITVKAVQMICKDKNAQIRPIVHIIQIANVLHNSTMDGTKHFRFLFMHHDAIILLLNAPFCLSCVPSKRWHSCYMMEYRLVSVLFSAITSNVPSQCLITEPDFLMTLLKFI